MTIRLGDFVRWLFVRPTIDDYEYPDHFTIEAARHALEILNAPIQWRWLPAQVIRVSQRMRRTA